MKKFSAYMNLIFSLVKIRIIVKAIIMIVEVHAYLLGFRVALFENRQKNIFLR